MCRGRRLGKLAIDITHPAVFDLTLATSAGTEFAGGSFAAMSLAATLNWPVQL